VSVLLFAMRRLVMYTTSHPFSYFSSWEDCDSSLAWKVAGEFVNPKKHYAGLIEGPNGVMNAGLPFVSCFDSYGLFVAPSDVELGK